MISSLLDLQVVSTANAVVWLTSVLDGLVDVAGDRRKGEKYCGMLDDFRRLQLA